jgi:hypothetical protein
MPSLDEILSSLTPESLENAILQIASQSEHDTIAVGLIADRILTQYGLEPSVGRGQALFQLAQKIAQQVALIEGMRFIEND